MSKKQKGKQGAHLTPKQKEQLLHDILAYNPAFSMFKDEFTWLIDEYSERDINIIDRLMKKSNSAETVQKETQPTISTYSIGSAEYDEITKRMAKARAEFEAHQRDIAEKARIEMEKKGLKYENASMQTLEFNSDMLKDNAVTMPN